MKRLLLYSVLMLHTCLMAAQGIPFLRNYYAEDYKAHNRNFDIVVSKDGIVYVANFEGVLYYDQAEWRIIHTPEITRVTVVYCDANNTIWVGGYNYFGKIKTKPNGELYLSRVTGRNLFRGEVQEIWESKDRLHFLVNDGKVYQIQHNEVSVEKVVSKDPLNVGLSDVVNPEAIDNDGNVVILDDVTQKEPLGNGLTAVVRRGRGIDITDDKGQLLYNISEENGICTNNIVYVGYNGHGQLWGATENGVSCVAVPSAFSRFTSNEGLMGEVLSIADLNGTKFVGTNEGLFLLKEKHFVRVKGVEHACWALENTSRGLLAGTANGIYRVLADGTISQLTSTSTTALLADGDQVYSGEMDGVFLIQTSDNSRRRVCELGKVTKIIKDAEGCIWLQNLYGEVWRKQASEETFKSYRKGVNEETASTIVELDGQLKTITVETEDPVPYPQFSYTDENGVTWLTDNESKSLYRWKNNKRLDDYSRLLFPFSEMSIRALYVHGSEVWIGGDKGITIIDTKQEDAALKEKPRLLFRSVILGSDSILWGGFGEMPETLPQLGSDDRNLRFTFALNYPPMVGKVLYRYKLNDGEWSAWDEDHEAEFFNLSHGSYTVYVQARLATGELSELVSMNFSIAHPFYLRWYMQICYILLALLLLRGIFRYRLKRLNYEKQKLEKIVQDRTAEVVKQKDEIEEKSKSLETALSELHETQGELIRQEKMATVGKLTQGLIDRILNPLNYINNFSKLSEGLVKDVAANVEDEKDHMTADNYDDTMDVLEMLRGNLQKVSEHGQNTTRTLKAMEEMLKDRSGGIVPMNLLSVLRQNEEMLDTYYANDISQYGIKTEFALPQGEVMINGNADQLSKVIMSLLGNAVYAVVKKCQRESFAPEVSLKLTVVDGTVFVVIRDNGIGIEDTIIDKIFDPFFTTKPTGEASGVGLYLSREIVQNYGGDIQVKSVKNEYSEFTITLPALIA